MSDVLPSLLRAPSGFKVADVLGGGLELFCMRPECRWKRDLGEGGVHLTELATLAVEHVQEAHR